MSFSLLPGVMLEGLTAVTPELLHRRGVRLLMLDFDNTIVPYTTNQPTQDMRAWLSEMSRSGIMLCVVSNSRKPRVREFCAAYGIACVTHAKKPFSRGIRQCLRQYGLPPEQCALVGDQIYTDVLGANCANVQSILIPAIHNHNIWLKLRHAAELPFIGIAKRRIIREQSEQIP